MTTRDAASAQTILTLAGLNLSTPRITPTTDLRRANSLGSRQTRQGFDTKTTAKGAA